jgi:protein TonB
VNQAADTDLDGGQAGALWRRWGGLIIGLVAVALLAMLVWHLLSDTASTKRKVADTAMLMLPPPPPPPPPEPEKLPEPEPPKVKPEVVEQKPATPDKPAEPKADAPPNPAADLANPLTINSDAQAGTDAFGIGAGAGGGGVVGGGGGGGGTGSFAGYAAYALQQLLLRDTRTRSLAFRGMEFDLWLDSAGKVDRVELVKGSGNKDVDDAVLATLRDHASVDARPPASVSFPMHIRTAGRRPA